MDTAVDCVVVADERGIIQHFNRAAERLFGYTENEAVGASISLLMPEPHRSNHERYLERYLETGETQIIGVGREIEAVHRDGTPIPIYLAVSEFEGSSGRCFAGILHDISAEVEARSLLRRLAETERLVGMAELAAALAHELNQPLSAIAVYAQAARRLAEGLSQEPIKLADALDKLLAQTRRAGQAVERVRGLFKGADVSFETTDVNALLLDMVELARVDLRGHSVTIEFEPEANLPAVECDPVQIQQVAVNLIRNAADSMLQVNCRNGSSISIKTRSLGEAVRVEVRDCGRGVDPELGNDIFQPFHTGKTDGLGMGLAISQTIALNHAGSLDYENITNGAGDVGGTCFRLTLPV